MKKKKSQSRVVWSLAAIALLLFGVFMTNTLFQEANRDIITARATSASSNKSIPTLVEKREQKRERAERLMEYTNEGNGEKLRLVLNQVVLRGEEGAEEIVQLNPPATPTTLGERLDSYSASMGVYPLAYVEGEEDTFDGLRLITREIRAKIPRDKAEQLAREYGLKILQFPEFAPNWVIFEAKNPLEALEKINAIRADEEVASADVLVGRRPVHMANPPNDPLFGEQWYLKRSGTALAGTDINVIDAWKYGETGGVLGTGIKIGIIDSGIQVSHPDYAGGGYDATIDYDFVGNDDNPSPQGDENHGTAVGGVAGARGNNSLGVSGVAPRATLVGERLITGNFITDLQIAQALAHRQDVIPIKNNSWGYTGSIYQLEPILKEAFITTTTTGRGGKGTIFAFSAGNSGDEEDSANYSELTSAIQTIAVGATDSKRRRAFYSEPGANLVITAPSNGFLGSLGISTTDRTSTSGYNNAAGAAGDYADDFSGTSSSCPVVSGVIALMLEANSDLGWRDVQDILIRSAVKFNPNEAGWKTNAAGLHFNNDYGAGLVDAAAAVEMARTWTNLEPQDSIVSDRQGLNASIPNNSAAGRTVQFSLPDTHLVVEHVTIKLDITHSARGELEIFLTSPSGTTSLLAFVRSDDGANYSKYTFSTVHNWGESSAGVWTLKVADRRNTNNTTGGTIKSAELTLFGVDAPPTNPPPNVLITSPANDSVFSPNVGYNIEVSANDFDIEGLPDTVEKVDLYENDVLVDTDIDIKASYSFARNPANGVYTYIARATDSEDLEGSSQPIIVTVKNQTPVIHAAVVDPDGIIFDDLAVEVISVDATDPENETITFDYLWEFSTDQRTYEASPHNTAILPPSPDKSSKLWRCAITASDGNTTSDVFYTTPVNLVDRPVSSVDPGQSFTYQSGLVLEGDDLEINRQAIIHEFSQGPGGGTSEWIEILTLQSGSLAGWSLADSSGNRLIFKTTGGIWDNIPAGTIIVVYRGTSIKDSLVPADDSSSADGKMILSSTNETYFETSSTWPTLDNLGDAIFLNDLSDSNVHQISYGNSLVASPRIGNVISNTAAYFAGDTDAGANVSGQWNITTAADGRASGFAFEGDSMIPGITLTNGRYEQNFNVEPGQDGTDFPAGWSAFSVDLDITQTNEVGSLKIFQGIVDVGGAFNFSSKIGLYAGTFEFDPSFIGLGIDNTLGSTGLKISYDVVKIINQTRAMQVELQYTVGPPGNTSSNWFTIAGTTYNSDTLPTGTVQKYLNVPLPAIFEDRDTPIYLRWYYRTAPGNGGTGGRDPIAFDNVIISSDQSPNIVMNLAFDPSSFAETAGENASSGTVSLNQVLTYPLIVNLSSNDVTEATVQSTVIIPTGQLSATFPVAAVDDNLSDGSQTALITASAINFVDVSEQVTITDNEPSLIGVTPGFPNTVPNAVYVQRLREGRITDPPIFRIAIGSTLPQGLEIDELTGLISGIIDSSVLPGSYPVTIELVNTLGGYTSQTIIIRVSGETLSDYITWIEFYEVDDETTGGDSDLDLIPNLVEYAMGSLPGVFENPSPILFEESDTEISLTYDKMNDRDDVELVAEWSETMEDGSWLTTGMTTETLFEDDEKQTIKIALAITPGEDKKFIRLRATLITPP